MQVSPTANQNITSVVGLLLNSTFLRGSLTKFWSKAYNPETVDHTFMKLGHSFKIYPLLYCMQPSQPIREESAVVMSWDTSQPWVYSFAEVLHVKTSLQPCAICPIWKREQPPVTLGDVWIGRRVEQNVDLLFMKVLTALPCWIRTCWVPGGWIWFSISWTTLGRTVSACTNDYALLRQSKNIALKTLLADMTFQS